ncbi:alpha/beta fold hydrolase [Devosia sp. ZW T5_3]|uniref:alpha/beta fold hydrolase n=1 Tax=Devosia sp. ZW T5_3 TaxID=3378085 RepID=UPI003854E4E7
MTFADDELIAFAEHGAAPLPAALTEGHLPHDGARIWYATYGSGTPVVLLHGGLGHSGNWGYQLPALIEAGYQPILIDSRGHGRSTRDERPYTYHLMASDVLAVLDHLGIARAAVIGWSDGACIGMVLGHQSPERVAGVFFFGCNMDPSGSNVEVAGGPLLERCFGRHGKDYAALSATPDQFQNFVSAVGRMMASEPNYTAADLAEIAVPVTIVQSEHDEFIKPEHARYLADTIPSAKLVELKGVSHFAPLQRPDLFNRVVLEFLESVTGTPS